MSDEISRVPPPLTQERWTSRSSKSQAGSITSVSYVLSLLFVSVIVSFLILQMILLPSSPLVCQVSPEFTQRLSGGLESKSTPLSPTSAPFLPQSPPSQHVVPIGSRLRLGFFHLLPESITEYFGLSIPKPESGTTQKFSLKPSDHPPHSSPSQSDATPDSEDEEFLINSLHDIMELVYEFRDYFVTVFQGAFLCGITASSEWLRHASTNLTHDNFMNMGLRALYPQGDYTQLDHRFGTCHEFLGYLDRHSLLGRITIAYLLLCLAVYAAYRATISTQPSFEDTLEDEDDKATPVTETTLPTRTNSPVRSISHASPIKSLIDQDVLASASLGSTTQSSNGFKSPKTPRTRGVRSVRRRRELMAAVASLLVRRKHRKSSHAGETPGSADRGIDRGVLPETFVARVNALATPARERLEARLEQSYESSHDFMDYVDHQNSRTPEDVEAQYYSELLQGIDADDEPPIGLVDDIEPRPACLNSDTDTEGDGEHDIASTKIVHSVEMKELLVNDSETSAMSTTEFECISPTTGTLPITPTTVSTVATLPHLSSTSPLSQVSSPLGSERTISSATPQPVFFNKEADKKSESQDQVRLAEHTTSQTEGSGVQSPESTSDIHRLRVQFETYDLTQTARAVELVQLISHTPPSAVIYRGSNVQEKEHSSTALWLSARACYVAVQELKQIKKRSESGLDVTDADPHGYARKLNEAREAIRDMYAAHASDTAFGSVETFMPASSALSDAEFWARFGLRQAYLAVEENDESASAHKWVAISADMVGQVTDRKTRITNARIFLTHTTRAVQLNPNDPTLYHMLGRFEFEIASLSWFQRTAAAALFGPLPDCSMSDAQKNLESAQSLRPLWPLNLLYLARAHMANGDTDKGRSILEQVASMVPHSTEDEIAIADAKSLCGL